MGTATRKRRRRQPQRVTNAAGSDAAVRIVRLFCLQEQRRRDGADELKAALRRHELATRRRLV